MQRTRVVDRLVIHGEPVPFRELCARAVPPGTRYLVLDLDRTLHLGRNMGELLGWEVCAWHAYGRDALAAAEPRRPRGRFFLDFTRPLALLRYLVTGARMWFYPGLYYLLFGKLPLTFARLRRWSFRRLGTDPVAAAQLVPQTALLHQLAAIPAEDLAVLARRVWERHGCDQVIEAEDLAWLRERCPGIRIVIASASPEPTVAVAAAALGVDDVICSTVPRADGYYAAPFQLHPRLPGTPPPRRLSGPGETRINSSVAKIANLFARYPDFADPRTVKVGITDTGHGEDHCWRDHFTALVDLNSTTPFPPIVDAASPLREIHSAAVLTRAEKARRAAGAPAWLDPRRPAFGATREYRARDLAGRLGALAAEVEALARRLDEQVRALSDARTRLALRIAELSARIEALVGQFNGASGPERRLALRQLRRALRARRALGREVARLERPAAELTFELTARLGEARGGL
jgi:phosphoserine phosphatase